MQSENSKEEKKGEMDFMHQPPSCDNSSNPVVIELPKTAPSIGTVLVYGITRLYTCLHTHMLTIETLCMGMILCVSSTLFAHKVNMVAHCFLMQGWPSVVGLTHLVRKLQLWK